MSPFGETACVVHARRAMIPLDPGRVPGRIGFCGAVQGARPCLHVAVAFGTSGIHVTTNLRIPVGSRREVLNFLAEALG